MLVLGVVVVLMLLAALVATEATNQLPITTTNQHYHAALAAAEAGVSNYLNELNQNGNYWTYNASNPGGNPAFNGPVPVSAGNTSETYTYTVDNTSTPSNGIVTLTSTGRSGNVTRSVKVEFSREGFLDNMLLSNYNLVDPSLYPVIGGSASQTALECDYYWYQPNPQTGGTGPQMNACSGAINYYITGQTMNGPVRSNDAFYLCGTPTFVGPVTSGDPSSPGWTDPAGNCGQDQPVFDKGISLKGSITFPQSDASLSEEVTPGVPGDGCLYTGPTAITLNSTGTMDVVSPETPSSDTNPGCVGTGVPLPANGVIYVQNLPSSQSCPAGFTDPTSWNGESCQNGDVYIQGTLKGQLTVAAENNIYVTGNLVYAQAPPSYPATATSSNTDVLGLITNNFIETIHPVDSQGNNVTGSVSFGATGISWSVPLQNVTIDAAMLALNNSFAAENFSSGNPLGTITINGCIAEDFMDIEGTFGNNATISNGYNTNYSYDPRLQYLTPPYFLTPVQAAWSQINFTEIPAN